MLTNRSFVLSFQSQDDYSLGQGNLFEIESPLAED